MESSSNSQIQFTPHSQLQSGLLERVGPARGGLLAGEGEGMSVKKPPKHIKLDKRNHVEKHVLDQLHGLVQSGAGVTQSQLQ